MTPSSALYGTDSHTRSNGREARRRVALQHAIEEAVDESALANAGRTMHIDGRRRALPGVLQGRLERVQVSMTADERRFRVCS